MCSSKNRGSLCFKFPFPLPSEGKVQGLSNLNRFVTLTWWQSCKEKESKVNVSSVLVRKCPRQDHDSALGWGREKGRQVCNTFDF